MPSTRHGWRRLIGLMGVALALLTGCAGAPKASVYNRDACAALGRHFNGLTGCFVLEELGGGRTVRVNPELWAMRLSPCSTFKIPHALIGLDAGVISGVDHVYEWDGSAQPYRSWERDHTLRSAFEGSVVWWFQRMAPQIGRDRMAAGLAKLSYGNQNLSSPIDRFWLYPGSLKISAGEQIAFLKLLYSDRAPFDAGAVSIVRDIMTLERAPGYTLSGKTGSGLDASRNQRVLNWFVGRLKTPEAEVVFACNVHSSGALDMQVARSIAMEILGDLGYLPASGATVEERGQTCDELRQPLRADKQEKAVGAGFEPA